MDHPPQAPPPARVIVCGGICTLRSRCVRFVIRRDTRALFRFAALLRQPGLDAQDVRSFLLIKDGQGSLRSDAVLATARGLGIGRMWLRLLRIVPRPWRDALYDFIARRRCRWCGREQACLVPNAGSARASSSNRTASAP